MLHLWGPFGLGTRGRASTFIGSALEVMMSLNVDSLQDEVLSFLGVRERLFEAAVSGTALPHLLAAFDAVWRQVVHEYEVVNADDRELICTLTSDAIITLAQVGVEPKDITRYTLAHVLFMARAR
jgi:hypothetical protein